MARRACTVFTLLLAGCAIEGKPDLLGFIEDGRTTREQVLLQLGPPSHVYEDQRILTFRIAEDAGGQYLRGPTPVSGWSGIAHSLVLVFDERGVLARHSLIEVKPH